jgi:hypothetical protein
MTMAMAAAVDMAIAFAIDKARANDMAVALAIDMSCGMAVDVAVVLRGGHLPHTYVVRLCGSRATA